ncbi:MAG: class I SAM-dependent methyltransferase [Tannerella sp.]|nr:class I SAM-dependent methyltransferase [Tannerella sp.]
MNENKYFESRYTFDKGRKKVWKAICQYLNNIIGNNHLSIVDIGSGYCDFINQIEADKKIAIDKNPEAKAFCDINVDFYSSYDEFFLTNTIVDVYFMSNLLEHLYDDECHKLLKSIYQNLKEGGKIIVIQPNYYYAYREYWDDYTHVKAYSHISLADLLISIGFKIQRSEKRFLPFTLKSLLPKTYWLTKLYLSAPFRPFAKQMLIIASK